MTALNKQALRQLAEKAGGEEWQSRKEPGVGGEYTVIVKGSLKKHQGWSTCRPVADQVVDKKTMDFISAANPATVLALLDELEAVQKTSAARLEAIDRTHKMFQCERDRADAAEKRIAELEARIVTLPQYRNSPDMHTKQFYEAIGFNQGLDIFIEALRAAGIGVKGE